jgi:hypothetical protein
VESTRQRWAALNQALEHYRREAAAGRSMPMKATSGVLATLLFELWPSLHPGQRAAFCSTLATLEHAVGEERSKQRDAEERAMRQAAQILERIGRQARA